MKKMTSVSRLKRKNSLFAMETYPIFPNAAQIIPLLLTKYRAGLLELPSLLLE
jgi:hypothetical protein